VRVGVAGSEFTDELTSIAPPDIDVDEADLHPGKSLEGYIVTLS
jgi:hypothetical protein